MIRGVPSPPRALTPADLTALIERFPVERAGAKGGPEVIESQAQLLLARIAALTDALRDGQGSETERLAARMLVGDLATVVGQFRGRANTVRGALTEAEQGLREALARFKARSPRAAPPARLAEESGDE